MDSTAQNPESTLIEVRTGEIKQAALELGFELVGVASADASDTIGFYENWLDRGFAADMAYLREHLPIKSDPKHLLPGAKSVVMVGLNYAQEPLPHVKIARYALGRDYHRVLRQKLKKLAARLPGDVRICVDSAPLLEREFAHRAGLGWFGKNTMLIDSKRGSWFLLGAILTTVELLPDVPAAGGCGTCHACIDACPTGAIVNVDGRWQVNAGLCISYQTIENRSDEIGPTHGWVFGCDVCQEVCPFNHARESQPLRAAITREPDFAPREWPSASELAEIDHPRWDALTAGTAVRRAGYDGLRRNARLAEKETS
jgi:epoxyqueuosine reductase